MKTVLAPIDFSPVTPRVIDEAIRIARVTDARLVLLNVVGPTLVVSSEFAETRATTERIPEAEAEVAARLTELQRALRSTGVTAHVVHRQGPVAEGIIEQAERLDADYIVMGSHGHSAIYDLIVGSTTSAVLKRAGCPVVIAPPCVPAMAT